MSNDGRVLVGTDVDGRTPLYAPEPAPARVSFGPKEWQSMQPEVASMLLTLWRERQPAQFGSYLAEILTGTAPRARK
jgi:hypothetical protein